MKPGSIRTFLSMGIIITGLLGVLVIGLMMTRPVRIPGASGDDFVGSSTGATPDGRDAATIVEGSGRRPSGILRRAAHAIPEPQPDVPYAAYERSLFETELSRLKEMESSTNPVVRGAANSVHQLLAARMEVRAEAVDEGGSASKRNDARGGPQSTSSEDPPAIVTDAIASHPVWSRSIQRDGARHEAFLHDAGVEFRRLGLPKAWDAYLTMFLLEAVDEIDMLAAIAVDGAPRMGEFPAEVIGRLPPDTLDPSLHAAWLHRQVTIGMLRRMGVPVDARFEHVFLDAGLGEGLTPYASR